MEAEKGTQLEKTTKRVRLTVAYDGTNYHGWQIQNNGITIESELNRCLTDLLREPVEVIGASRTDSGVHALGNIAVFDTTSRMPAEKISYALNQRLPEDIRIQKSEQVPDDWHPRRCDSRKTYEYRIYRAQFPMPVKRLYSLFTYYELDVNLRLIWRENMISKASARPVPRWNQPYAPSIPWKWKSREKMIW